MIELPKLEWVQTLPGGREWVRQLPALVKACVDQWSLKLEPPYPDSNVAAAFPVTTAEGMPAVMKIQFPGRESEHEAEALRRWNGRGAVRLLARDPAHHALLIERCDPGSSLSDLSADEALGVIIDLLPRLWIKADKPFHSLHDESLIWAEELLGCWERGNRPFEEEMLIAALDAMDQLRLTQGEQVLLNQDLHPGNVLRATREPWLLIDPKPLVGEREFIAPIVRCNEFGHSRKHVMDRLDRLTSALGLDRERVRYWSFAQTLAWSFEGDHAIERYVETARWLWRA